MLGIGGGGDVVGALSSAITCQRSGVEAIVGGVSWERMPIDPHPGPRRLDELIESEPLAPAVALAGPRTRTSTDVRFAESHMAELLGEQTLIVDPSDGPTVLADSLVAAAARLEADLLVLVDVGGDVLADGSEPGLASPLCDAVLLAAGAITQSRGLATIAAIFGPCCDGELTLIELMGHIASVSAAGGLLGVTALDPEQAGELEQAIEQVPTEASAMAIRCANGEIGPTTIRNGRRAVELSPVGAMTFYFEPTVALATAAALAQAVRDCESLEQANDRLHALGVRTELDYERDVSLQA